MIEHDKCKYIDDRSFYFFFIKFARTSACKFLVNNDRSIPKGQTKYIINIAILVRQLNGRPLTSSNWSDKLIIKHIFIHSNKWPFCSVKIC